MALFSFPLTAALQLMCARLGMVTGRGLAGVIRRYYPRWVLWGACLLLIVANVFNIGADLGGMAAATALVTGIGSFYWTPIFTALIILVLIFSSYRLIAKIFKWLTLVLFSYILTAFLARADRVRPCMPPLFRRFYGPARSLRLLSGSSAPPSAPFFSSGKPPRKSMKKERKGGRRSPAVKEQPMRNCVLHALTSWSGCFSPIW